jgi:phosphate transporter
VKHVRLLLAVGLGACILSSDLLLHVSPFAHRCLALLAFTVAMWALEAIPYFATALLVPILVVVFQVLEVRQPQHTRLILHNIQDASFCAVPQSALAS